MDQACPECGVKLEDEGCCSICGFDRNRELEIAAFMGPAIKRARLWLVVLGALYIVGGAVDCRTVSEAREQIAQHRKALDEHRAASKGYLDVFADFRADTERELRKHERVVSRTSFAVVFSIIAGFLQMGLALWAREKALPAFKAAIGLFVCHTLVLAIIISPVYLLSLIRVLFAIVLVFGVLASRKAEALRTGSTGSLDPAFKL